MTKFFSDKLKGRWQEILPLVGLSPKILNKRNCPCPMCGGKDRFRFTDKDYTGMWICTKCGAGHGISLVMKFNGWDFKTAAKAIDAIIRDIRMPAPKNDTKSPAELHAAMVRAWQDSAPVTPETPAGIYLTRRCGLTTYPQALRASPGMCYRADDGDLWFPAMLARVSDRDGKSVNLQRTFLTEDGDKAPVNPPRRMMAGSVPHGSAVRLGAAGDVLGIGEGIETCLAAAQRFGVPVWAALGTSGMVSWRPPAGVRRVLVIGDNDRSFAGQAAAYKLAYDLRTFTPPGSTEPLGDGIEVHIPGHDTMGRDWADVVTMDDADDDVFQERAAIIEYEGEMPRAEAVALARIAAAAERQRRIHCPATP